MITLRVALVGFFSGILFGLSWVIYIYGQTTTADKFVSITIYPALLATLSAVMINLVDVVQVAKNSAVKVWLFIWFTLHALCIGWGIYIITVVYTPEDNLGGVLVLIQTVVMLMSGLLFFLGRKDCKLVDDYDIEL